MDEGTGIGLMISSRQKDVVQPKPLKPKKAKRAAKSPLVRIKGLQGGPMVQPHQQPYQPAKNATQPAQKVQTESQLSMKHMTNVRSVEDVLSNLSA